MSEIKEFIKANLQAIVDNFDEQEFDGFIQLEADNPAWAELRRIARDKHDVAACFANMVIDLEITKSVSYLTPEDLGRPLPKGLVIRVTAEYVPESECEKPAEK